MTNFNTLKFSALITQRRWEEAAELVKFTLSAQSSNPDNLERVIKIIKCDLLTTQDKKLLLLELLRALRNSAVVTNNRDVLNNLDFFEDLARILRKLNNEVDDELLVKILLQFLVNLISTNPQISPHIHDILYDDIIECLQKKKNNYEVLALLYNIHYHQKTINFREMLFETILNNFNESSCEYSEFLVELFFFDENFWKFYQTTEISHRITVLEVLKKFHETNSQKLPKICIKTLSAYFSNSTDIIFQTVSKNDESLEPLEISTLLNILGTLSGDEEYLRILQEDKELLIRSGVVLINLHRLGKQSENYFTSVQKLKELKEPNEVLQKHPAFGFKVGLVRLIGNLCWKNKTMQNLAREAEIIPILLDCCNIDARNPLIMQWVILAIRNLCEDNLDNQRIIAGLHKEGTVSSALIEEMGLTLQNDESGGIRIVPLDLKK